MIKLNSLKPDPDNPRVITNKQFQKLCNSIKQFPQMMELNPLVIDKNNVIHAGNMRYKALLHLNYEEIPDAWVIKANRFSEKQLKEFKIKDNISYGEWDFDMLANEYDEDQLNDWALNVFQTNINMPDDKNQQTKKMILNFTYDQYQIITDKLAFNTNKKEKIIFDLIVEHIK